MRNLCLLLLSLSLLTAVSCSDNSTGNSNEETIEWATYISQGGAFGQSWVDIDANLSVSNNNLEGDGTITYYYDYSEEELSDTLQTTITGTRTDDSVTLTGVTNGGEQVFSFNGTLGTNTFDEQAYIGQIEVFTNKTPQDTLLFSPAEFPY